MDHPIRLDHTGFTHRSWRTATIVVAAVAALELALLVMLAGALVAKPEHPARKTAPARTTTAPAKAKAKRVTHATTAKPKPKPTHNAKTRPAKPALAAELPRRKVTVLVLNGNGRQGAAAAAASRVSRRGYRIGLVANAPSHDYATSLVMYRPGFRPEARRLARDLGVRVVSPLDGVRPAQLHGAQAVLILGG